MVHPAIKIRVHVFTGRVLEHNNNVLIYGGQVNFSSNSVILYYYSIMISIGAKVAHDSCYTSFNPSGSMTGHCGYDSRLHKYIPCFNKYDFCFVSFSIKFKIILSSDVKCGLLHCEGGMPYPRVASSNFMIFNVNTGEGSFECK